MLLPYTAISQSSSTLALQQCCKYVTYYLPAAGKVCMTLFPGLMLLTHPMIFHQPHLLSGVRVFWRACSATVLCASTCSCRFGAAATHSMISHQPHLLSSTVESLLSNGKAVRDMLNLKDTEVDKILVKAPRCLLHRLLLSAECACFCIILQ